MRADKLGMHSSVRLLSTLPSKSKSDGFGRGTWSSQRQNLWSTGEPLTQPSCTATRSDRQPTMKMHLSHPYFIYKITVLLCYSRLFACCETTVINQKTISAAILKSALPNISRRLVTLQFSFSGFPFFIRTVQSHFITHVVLGCAAPQWTQRTFPGRKVSFARFSSRLRHRGIASL